MIRVLNCLVGDKRGSYLRVIGLGVELMVLLGGTLVRVGFISIVID